MRKRLLLALSLMFAGPACSSDGDSGPGAASGGASGSPGSGGRGGSSTGAGGAGGSSSSGGASGSSATGGGGGSPSTGGTSGGGGSGRGGSGGSGGSTPKDGPGSGGTGGGSGDGGAAPTPGGCGAGAKFCDDFEGQTAGMPPKGMFTVQTTGGGSLLVDGVQAYSGKQSVAVKAPRGGGYPGNFLVFNQIAAQLPENDLHGRAMIFVKALPGQAHFDTVTASGALAGGGNSTYVLGGMYKKFMSVYHPGDCSVDSSTPFPEGKWACIQWQFKGAKDGTHLHKMMLDGQVVNNGEQNGNQGFCVQGASRRDWKAPTFSTLKIGHVHFGGAPSEIELWIDDLAWGDQPIPCPPAK